MHAREDEPGRRRRGRAPAAPSGGLRRGAPRAVSHPRDRASGRSWTATHELVARCDFRAVVTTNYDPGIVDARMRVRPDASATGHVTWADETAMDRWRSGDAFDGRDVLPVLYAHGHHNRPEDIVLATNEYRRAYAGKLARVLGELVVAGRLVWIGFSFADQRIAAILREVGESACAIQYGTDVVLYPARHGTTPRSASCSRARPILASRRSPQRRQRQLPPTSPGRPRARASFAGSTAASRSSPSPAGPTSLRSCTAGRPIPTPTSIRSPRYGRGHGRRASRRRGGQRGRVTRTS